MTWESGYIKLSMTKEYYTAMLFMVYSLYIHVLTNWRNIVLSKVSKMEK